MLKRTTYKTNRPRSNTDGISAYDPRKKDGTQPESEDKRALINVTLPNFRCTTIKIPPELPMEAILSYICEKNALDFKQYTLQFNDVKSTVVEMDRPVGYYYQDMKISEVFIVPGEKVYRTKCVNENGVDVLLLQNQNGGYVDIFICIFGGSEIHSHSYSPSTVGKLWRVHQKS
jgi:hypothetical protein